MSAKHLTAPQAKELIAYLDVVKPLLRVADWNIELVAEWCDDECDASVFAFDQKKLAHLRVSERWPTMSPATRRHTVVHEMLHLLHRDQLEPIYLMRERGRVNKIAWEITMANVRQHTEVMVDTLADIIAPTVPLP